MKTFTQSKKKNRQPFSTSSGDDGGHHDSDNDSDNNGIDPSELEYSLEIVQQPQYARMCGYGDKDRRHVTPAPVLKLIARAPDGNLVSARYLGRQSFVVSADLWLEDEVTDRNLVVVSSIVSTKLPSKAVAARQAEMLPPGFPPRSQAQEANSATNTLESQVPPSPSLSSTSREKRSTTSSAKPESTLLLSTSYAEGKDVSSKIDQTQDPSLYQKEPNDARKSRSRTRMMLLDTQPSPSSPPSSGKAPAWDQAQEDQVQEDQSSMEHMEQTASYRSESARGSPFVQDAGQESEHVYKRKPSQSAERDKAIEGQHGQAYGSGDDREDGSDEEEEEEVEYYEEGSEWNGVVTRNLVGQTAVGGAVAPDLQGTDTHIWFAFSALSIRTEGVFKLRFVLTDLARVGQGKDPYICQIFSDPVQVQSPKRFLGACDNNEIANHLNSCSIRIPSRKSEPNTKDS